MLRVMITTFIGFGMGASAMMFLPGFLNSNAEDTPGSLIPRAAQNKPEGISHMLTDFWGVIENHDKENKLLTVGVERLDNRVVTMEFKYTPDTIWVISDFEKEGEYVTSIKNYTLKYAPPVNIGDKIFAVRDALSLHAVEAEFIKVFRAL